MTKCNHTTQQSCLNGDECAQCLRDELAALRAENARLAAALRELKYAIDRNDNNALHPGIRAAAATWGNCPSTALADLLAPTITQIDCALDFMEGRTRVSFSGTQWHPSMLKKELARLNAIVKV